MAGVASAKAPGLEISHVHAAMRLEEKQHEVARLRIDAVAVFIHSVAGDFGSSCMRRCIAIIAIGRRRRAIAVVVLRTPPRQARSRQRRVRGPRAKIPEGRLIIGMGRIRKDPGAISLIP